ncbi:GIY-YIG nuclease family protein [uncultured Tessaracoccus sp.]|uniref:GIY-YIG nuclease family protein n=1 Tax=uncultured Tessaracoccus sp. TaxID=905023 RepID=UPI00345CE558
MAWIYMLRCNDGTFYVGSTRDLHTRLATHAAGQGATYTRRRLPVAMVYAAEFECVADAFAMEKRVQGWSHAKRQALIDGDWEEIKRLSKKPRNR